MVFGMPMPNDIQDVYNTSILCDSRNAEVPMAMLTLDGDKFESATTNEITRKPITNITPGCVLMLNTVN